MALVSFDSFTLQHKDFRRRQWPDSLYAQLSHASRFLQELRRTLQYGELSRAPLRLLRFQISDGIAECDWMARSPDPWDAGLPSQIQQEHETLQAIRDAIDIRAFLFDAFPNLETANLNAYRESVNFTPEIIIAGSVHRNDQSARSIHSIVMRAKVLGFRFRMEGAALKKL